MEVLDATSLSERLKWEAKECWLHLEAGSPLEKYPAGQHARRVQEKLGVEEGLIYLGGQVAKNNEDSDMPAPFRQLRYFYYLSGCNEANCHLTYDIQHDILSLFIPRIDEKRVIWNGRGSTLAEALVKYDVDEVYYSDELSTYIADWFHRSHNRGHLYALHDKRSQQNKTGIGQSFVIDTTSLQPAMNLARMIKDDHEIKLIRKANDISSLAHKKVLASISKFKNEAEVEGLFLDVCVSRQAKEQAYDPIAASGPNAGTLHYDANNEDLEDRQLMCLDAGCEYELYASDITRTFPLSASWPTKEAENIYKLVERMQESCIERLAPGVRYLDLHILAHQIAIDGLLALGILHNGTKEEIYKAGTSRAFFPHGLGHHIGLEVHDVGQTELMSVRRGKPVLEQTPSLFPENFHLPVYDSQTCHAPTDPQSSHLEEGMVVTVEPGIYFSLYALQHFYLPSPTHAKYINVEVLKRYFPVGGVRIEDDVLITSKGYENLTSAPKGDAMLAIIRSGNLTRDFTDTQTTARPKSRSKEQAPLFRAPGLPSKRPVSILKPIARSVTMPTEFKQRGSFDLEPFEGPSLFCNFKRSMTTDENVQHWQRERDSALAARIQVPLSSCFTAVCGDDTQDVRHVYMTPKPDQAHSLRRDQTSEMSHIACNKCTILCEALDRLRKNLTMSERSSPRPEAQPVFAMAVTKDNLVQRSSAAPPTIPQVERKKQQVHHHIKPKFNTFPSLTPGENVEGTHTQPRLSRNHLSRQELASETITQCAEPKSDFKGGYSRHSPYVPPTPINVPPLPPQLFSEPENMSVEDWRKHQDSKLEKLRNTQRVFRSVQCQDAQGDVEARPDLSPDDLRAKRTLRDLAVQRQNEERLGTRSERCTFGSEQPDLPDLPSLQIRSRPKLPQFSTQDRLSQLQAHIRHLEARLQTHGPAQPASQPASQNKSDQRRHLERTEIEEKLRRLRSKQVALVA